MEWLLWPVVVVIGLIGLFAVMDAAWPKGLASFQSGLNRTEAGLDQGGRNLSRIGFALAALATLPVIGLLIFGWIGLVAGLVIGVLLVGRR